MLAIGYIWTAYHFIVWYNWFNGCCYIYERAQTHEDYRGLERAKEAMVDVAQYINEVKRDSEHMVIIQKARVSDYSPLIRTHLCTASLISKISVH